MWGTLDYINDDTDDEGERSKFASHTLSMNSLEGRGKCLTDGDLGSNCGDGTATHELRIGGGIGEDEKRVLKGKESAEGNR